jgi:hypothetical protein
MRFLSVLLIIGSLILVGTVTRIPAENVVITKIDRDGDDLFEYIRFPYDCDGDGTTWTPCTDAETPEKACAYNGERVWSDFNDDFACAVDYLEAGGTIELEDGIYPIRAYTCSGGTNPGESCNLSDNSECDGGGTCTAATDGYTETMTYPNGERRSGPASVVTLLPSARKTGMKLTAVSSADFNGYTDGIRSGAWIVDDKGNTWDQAGSKRTDAALNGFVTGVSHDLGSDEYGETLFDATCSTYGTDGYVGIIAGGGSSPSMPGVKTICVDNSEGWVDNCATAGMPILLYGTALNQAVQSHQQSYVTGVCDSGNAVCDCGTGKFVSIDGMSETVGDSATPWAYIAKTDIRYRVDNPIIERIAWAPQNSFDLDWIESENSPINCGEAYVTGQNDPTTYDNACDLTSIFGWYPSYGSQVRHNAWITPSSLHSGTVDGADVNQTVEFGPGNVVRYGAGTGFMDMSGNLWVHHNFFEGCQMGEFDKAACLFQLGEGTLVEHNKFNRIGFMVCGDGEIDAGKSVQRSTECATPLNVEYYCGQLISLKTDVVRMRFNRFLAINACANAVVELEGPDNMVEFNDFVGTISGFSVWVTAAAHRTKIRFNTFEWVPGWGELAADWGHDYDRLHSMPIAVSVNGTAPNDLTIFGNKARFEDSIDDVTPEEANCFVGVSDIGDSIGVADHWNIQDNTIRGYYSLICDTGDNPELEGSWDETFPTPYAGDWINTHSNMRLSWKGTADGFNSRPTCNAAAKGHFYMFYNVADHSCVDPGNDAQTSASPCYCDGTGPAWTELDLWP